MLALPRTSGADVSLSGKQDGAHCIHSHLTVISLPQEGYNSTKTKKRANRGGGQAKRIQGKRFSSLRSASMRALSWLLLCSFRGTSALQPSRPGVSRRPLLQHALALGVLAPGAAAAAAEKKPSLKEVVAQLDAGTPKEERNAHGEKADHFPQIAFEGGQGQGKKVVFTVPHQNLSPPSFSYIEYMWIKDEESGAILTARKFRPSDPDLVITAFGSSGQRLTAASKDDKFGIWQGTFRVP